ncbi:MAG: hypothetical protein ACFFFO_16215 [Candidatus Thorarchaeota archaeon]
MIKGELRGFEMRLIALGIVFMFLSGIVCIGPVEGKFSAQTSITLAEWITGGGLDVQFCSYFGGNGEEWSNDIFCFTDGYVLTGMTRSSNLPVVNAHQEEYGGGGDVFIVMLDSEFQVEYYTYFGGSGLEEPMAMVRDAHHNIIVAGGTSSDDLTLLNPIQDQLNGSSDAFLAKFSSNGTLLFSSYLGGSGFDRIEDIIINQYGEYVIVGSTESTDFPTTPGAYQEEFGGGNSDVFITSISSVNHSILFSTFFGNTTNDDAWAINYGASNDLAMVGMTNGASITTDAAYQQTFGGGLTDCFVAKFNSDCSSLYWSTLLGGDGWDFGDQVDFDDNDNIIVSGYTGSSDFPLVDQLQNDSAGYDAFVSRLNEDGDELLWSSYLGGNLEDRSYAMEVLEGGGILITMPSASSDMPTIDAFQATNSGGSDGYIALIYDRDADDRQNVTYASYFGGSLNDYVLGMSIRGNGNIAVIGYTSSEDLPTLRAVQDEYGGGVSDTMVWILSPKPLTLGGGILPIDVVITVATIVCVVLFIGYSLRRR